ncbi:NFX1-type zinc finger-containing protein 1-like [Lytechinus variegatus]|uniref:NFX1-type zinc finger-containing protein 1-like n=1 Tax=Lytechinus variegatus TaxID=7654 RepID=UPI001BB240DD|nr:NFX1-type zinc finger-containing protein 1-like [Lytechinus variegatus]
MAEKTLSDRTNFPSRGREPTEGTNGGTGSATGSKVSGASKDHEEKSVRPKERKTSCTKNERSGSKKSVHFGRKDHAEQSGGRTHQNGRHHQKQRDQREQHGYPARGRRYPPKTPTSKTGVRGKAIEVEGCGLPVLSKSTDSRFSKDRLSSSSGPKDKRTFQPISSNFLNDLLMMEPSEAAIQLGSLKGSFVAGLEEVDVDDKKQRLFWNVLAHLSDGVGVASTVIMIFSVVVGSRLFNKHLPLFLIGKRGKACKGGALEFVGFIAVLLRVLESMSSSIPSRLADIKVALVLMEDVINSIDGELTQDVALSAKSLLQYIESVEADKELAHMKQRFASSKPPPDDFRQQSILPSYEELKPSHRPYLRPHIVKGVYPNANHYFDVHFRLMKEDFIQPLRSGLDQYLLNKQVQPENRVKVQDVRIYEEVELIRPESNNFGVTYLMSFKRMPHVRWEVSKRLIYGSLVLLSDDEFKSYISATVANSDARQLARGVVDIRLLDEAMSSLIGKTFVMVESTVFFEAYRHVLTGLQQVSPTDFPMTRYILELRPDINPPTYMKGSGHAILDVSNLMVGGNPKNTTDGIKPQITPLMSIQINRIPTCSAPEQGKIDTPFPISVLNEYAWPGAKETKLNPSQLEAVKSALTQELSLIQGPPGTGKTYIGLKIVETLLKNKNCWSDKEAGPILLVCYTNHALDQFLLGIKQFQDEGIIRVGSRSKCPELENNNLKQAIRMKRFRNTGNKFITRRAGNIKRETTLVKRALEGVQTRIQLSSQGILRETELKHFHVMSEKHFKSMKKLEKFGYADSWIIEWLIPDNESVKEVAQNHEEETTCDKEIGEGDALDSEEVDKVDDNIDVENERDLIESERVNNDDVEDDESSEVKVVKNLSPLAVYYDDLLSSDEIDKDVKNFLREKATLQKEINPNKVTYIRDVWKLDVTQRWELYHHWLGEYMSILEAQLPVLQNEYTQLCTELQETNDYEKCLVLQQATIVGMTTTRAASERELLKRVQPRITIVEEAAEVLESHIITSLHSTCQQLILIGDHQQLRPKPNVYQLATKYHLDVSMFERMVKNGFPYKKLRQQHRMRPEISSLMRDHFYPELEDHESVSSYHDVRGVGKNIFFLDHQEEEAHVKETMSHYNLHEVDFTVELCRYLLNQGYKPEQITILTAYTGQLLKFKGKMDRATFEGVRVASVDNYQGEENDIILLSFVRSSQNGRIGFLSITNRVCVALSRAKEGLYCIGNFTLYSKKCKLWRGIYDDLIANCRIGDVLNLQCYNHPHNKTDVKRAADFQKVPNGGCGIPCGTLLNCGHVCVNLCHPVDRLHENYICPKPCTNKCERGHDCSEICGIKCPPCRKKMEKKLPCGHFRVMKCSQDPTSVKCDVMVEKTKLPCEHIVKLPCYMDINSFDCPTTVRRQLQCGHFKFERCSEHGMCSVIVSKNLPCGHIKLIECSKTDNPDIVCTELVSRTLSCSHRKELKCNVDPDTALCLIVVTKTRPSCGHLVIEECSTQSDCSQIVVKSLPCGHRMDMVCSTDENGVFCQEKCEKKLACGHTCTGICGEKCITKCKVFVIRNDWPCGHRVKARCSDGPDSCHVRCQTELGCGHMCHGTCGSCMGGKYHLPCRDKCDRTLVCGHKCTLDCVSPCLPCFKTCENFCDHIKCNHPCGEVCPPCTKRCNWNCPHSECQMLCCEPCSRLPCDEPCPKQLKKCGHPCAGLCGEICPELCRICDEVKLKETFASQDTDASRFMQLEECGHVFEVSELDRHLGLHQKETTNSFILLKRCPKCSTPLRNSRRYGTIIKLSRRHVLHVKKKMEARKSQVMSGKRDLQANMMRTLTLANLNPLGIEQHTIGIWLRRHKNLKMEYEPALTSRLLLIRILIEMHEMLTNICIEDRYSSAKSHRDKLSSKTKSSFWKGHTDMAKAQMAELGKAVLRDATSFSHQEANDLHEVMHRTIYSVLLLINWLKSTDRQRIRHLEDSLKVLDGKHFLRNHGDADLKQMRQVFDDLYKSTLDKWLENIQEFHPSHTTTFAREKWCQCPKGHTFMVQEDTCSISKMDCDVCMRIESRHMSLKEGQSPHARSSATVEQKLTEREFRRLAIEVPSCGPRRGPGKMPYNSARSMNTSHNAIKDESHPNRSKNSHGEASARKTNPEENEDNKGAFLHAPEAIAKDLTTGTLKKRTNAHKRGGTPNAGPHPVQDITTTPEVSQHNSRTTMNTMSNEKRKPQGKVTPSQGNAASNSRPSIGVTADRGKPSTRRRGRQRRARRDDGQENTSGDVQRETVRHTIEQHDSTSGQNHATASTGCAFKDKRQPEEKVTLSEVKTSRSQEPRTCAPDHVSNNSRRRNRRRGGGRGNGQSGDGVGDK